MLTISGAYGRDYKSKAAILEDWHAGKDFVIRTFGPDDGRYINCGDAELNSHYAFQVRYKSDRNVAVIKYHAAHARWI